MSQTVFWMRYKTNPSPPSIRPNKMNFHTKFPKGNTSGVKAMPMAPKNVMTQGAHPKVNNPKMKDKKGMLLPPKGSVLLIKSEICEKDSMTVTMNETARLVTW